MRDKEYFKRRFPQINDDDFNYIHKGDADILNLISFWGKLHLSEYGCLYLDFLVALVEPRTDPDKDICDYIWKTRDNYKGE